MPLGDYWPAPVWTCLHGIPYGQTCLQCQPYTTWTNVIPSGWKCPECSGISAPSSAVCLWCAAKSVAAQAAPPRRVPVVGAAVHYVSFGTPGGEYKSECRAAIVTAVQAGGGEIAPGTASLAVLNPTGMFFSEKVGCDPGPDEGIGTNLCGGRLYRGGTWHWPERAEN